MMAIPFFFFIDDCNIHFLIEKIYHKSMSGYDRLKLVSK